MSRKFKPTPAREAFRRRRSERKAWRVLARRMAERAEPLIYRPDVLWGIHALAKPGRLKVERCVAGG